jgi:hypothetical protein
MYLALDLTLAGVGLQEHDQCEVFISPCALLEEMMCFLEEPLKFTLEA